ncbi:ABC transporter substrate-binding protein [Bradyrhizobium sp. AZCC 2230]|uniref:ABC transporter substrate-binding protein n=1 Tax=Bradyrhizobium sp. AZCC 2230 TaxID=3117021 RepID=UPI002FEF21A6
MLSRRKVAVLAFSMLLMLAGPASAEDLRIGAIFPLSGANADYGDLYMGATELAVSHLNDAKVLGGKLSIAYEDSQALPQQGVIAMNKLVNVEKVSYVLSAFTGVSKAISTAAARSRTVAVNGGGVGPDLAELGEYFWNVIPLANFEVRAMAPYLVQKRGLKRFVLVYVDDPLGQSIKRELESSLPSLGATLAEALSVPPNAQQFSGVAARVRDAKPDVVYIASFGAQQSQIIKQLRDNGVTQQLASYSGFAIPAIASLPEAKGALFTTQRIDWNSDDPVSKRFTREYQAKTNRAPTAYAANYYNAVFLYGTLASALQKAGLPITGENLLAKRREIGVFDLVGGRVTFEKDGTIRSAMQINEVDGEPAIVETVAAH